MTKHFQMRNLSTVKGWSVLQEPINRLAKTSFAKRIFELGLPLSVGLMAGVLLTYSWGLPSLWQQLLLVIPVVIVFVLLINDLEKIVLAAIALGVPLNLDVSVIMSPYTRNLENMARGVRTIAALTELRVSIVDVVVVVGYALWIIEARSKRKPVHFFAGTTIPALGLIFFSILSMFQAQDFQLAYIRVVQLIELFLIYFYLANHLRTLADMQFFVMVAIGGLFMESMIIIWQSITGQDFLIAGIQGVYQGPGRIGGTLDNPGPAGGYLSALGLIACTMIWAFQRRSQKIFVAISFGLGCIALVNTGSRIGWGAFAATMLLFVLIGLRLNWIKRETLFLLVVAVLALGIISFDTIYTRYTADDHGSAEARPMMYRMAGKMIHAHPWLGVGAGNSALATRDYYTPDVGEAGQVIDLQVHNRYLIIWAESGTFAVLCFVSFLGVAAVKAGVCIKSNHHWIALMGAGLAGAIISFAIQMTTGSFTVRPVTLFSWLLPALAASLYHLDQTLQEQQGTFDDSL